MCLPLLSTGNSNLGLKSEPLAHGPFGPTFELLLIISDCVCLNTSETCVLGTIGIQRQIISSLDEVGPTALLNPPRLYKACVSAGLTPLYMDTYNRDPSLVCSYNINNRQTNIYTVHSQSKLVTNAHIVHFQTKLVTNTTVVHSLSKLLTNTHIVHFQIWLVMNTLIVHFQHKLVTNTHIVHFLSKFLTKTHTVHFQI